MNLNIKEFIIGTISLIIFFVIINLTFEYTEDNNTSWIASIVTIISLMSYASIYRYINREEKEKVSSYE